MVFEKMISGNPLYDHELKRAPWKIETDNFARIEVSDLIDKTLHVIKNDYVLLVLASIDGNRYGNTILAEFDQETLSIDRPLDFDEKAIGRFRIYFQDILGVWCFFEVETVAECSYSLCATYPKILYRLQRRQYHRVEVPQGTRTVFWEKDNLRDGGYVKDLSAAGMLICTGSSETVFDENAEINEIAIALPHHPSLMRKEGPERLALPVIRKGRIVRSFKDCENNQVCHGISFEYDEKSELELARFVEAIKGREPK